MNILLIDDNLSDVYLIQEMLKEVRNIRLTTLNSGKEAIACIVKIAGKQDLIILDYDLPCHNGIEILEELRKFNKQVPVVIFSSSDLIECEEDIYRLGALYTRKPMNYEDYSTKVKSFLNLVKTKYQNETFA